MAHLSPENVNEFVEDSGGDEDIGPSVGQLFCRCYRRNVVVIVWKDEGLLFGDGSEPFAQ
jgi:hypothetical protein